MKRPYNKMKVEYNIMSMGWQLYEQRRSYEYGEIIDGIPARKPRWVELHNFKMRSKAAFKRRRLQARLA